MTSFLFKYQLWDLRRARRWLKYLPKINRKKKIPMGDARVSQPGGEQCGGLNPRGCKGLPWNTFRDNSQGVTVVFIGYPGFCCGFFSLDMFPLTRDCPPERDRMWTEQINELRCGGPQLCHVTSGVFLHKFWKKIISLTLFIHSLVLCFSDWAPSLVAWSGTPLSGDALTETTKSCNFRLLYEHQV